MSERADGFDLDEIAGGLWRCVHSKTRIAGVGLTREAAQAECEANMKIARAEGVPEPIDLEDTTPVALDDHHDG